MDSSIHIHVLSKFIETLYEVLNGKQQKNKCREKSAESQYTTLQ